MPLAPPTTRAIPYPVPSCAPPASPRLPAHRRLSKLPLCPSLCSFVVKIRDHRFVLFVAFFPLHRLSRVLPVEGDFYPFVCLQNRIVTGIMNRIDLNPAKEPAGNRCVRCGGLTRSSRGGTPCSRRRCDNSSRPGAHDGRHPQGQSIPTHCRACRTARKHSAPSVLPDAYGHRYCQHTIP